MKKLLALVLALVMTLGLATVGTNAATELKDTASVGDDYQEAVTVVNAVEVMIGDENGNFNPSNKLTRAEGAAIAARLIATNKVAAELIGNGTKFSDVPANFWNGNGSGMIEYCAVNGILNGVGDNKFDPNGALSAVAFAKMMLTALGYDSQVEGYVNNVDWATHVMTRANRTGILKGLETVKPTDQLTREQAAQIVFNTLKTAIVEYDTKLYTSGGDVLVGSTNAKPVTNEERGKQTIYATRINATTNAAGGYVVEFAEQYYPALVLTADEDDFGRPASNWTYGREQLGVYGNYDLLVTEWTTLIDGDTVYDAMGALAYKNYAKEVWVDGVELTGTAKTDVTNEIKKDGDDLAVTGRGVLTQLFVDDANEYARLVIINTYLAEALTDYNATNKNISLGVYEANWDTQVSRTAKLTDDNAIADLKLGDKVLVTMIKPGTDNYVIESVKLAEVNKDATVSAYTTNSAQTKMTSITVDGTKTNVAAKALWKHEILANYSLEKLKNFTYDVYLDTYGNIIGIDYNKQDTNFVFVVGAEVKSTFLAYTTYTANVIWLDGTMQTISFSVSKSAAAATKTALTGNAGTGNPVVNAWFTYSKDDNGNVTVNDIVPTKAAATAAGVTYEVYQSANQVTNIANAAEISATYATLDATTTSASDFAYGNDKSVYITVDVDRTGTYAGGAGAIKEVTGISTGIKNTSVEVAQVNTLQNFNGVNYGASALNVNNSNTFFMYSKSGYVLAAVVIGENSGVGRNFVYVISGPTQRSYNGRYLDTYKVIKDGEITTIDVDSQKSATTNTKLGTHRLHQVAYDKDGVVIEIKDATKWTAAGLPVTANTTINTALNKTNGYTYNTVAANANVTLDGSTLKIAGATANNTSYVLIGEGCKFFVRNPATGTYEAISNATSALSMAKSKDGTNQRYIKAISSVIDGNTGFANTVIFYDTYSAVAVGDDSIVVKSTTPGIYSGAQFYTEDAHAITWTEAKDALEAQMIADGVPADSIQWTAPNMVSYKFGNNTYTNVVLANFIANFTLGAAAQVYKVTYVASASSTKTAYVVAGTRTAALSTALGANVATPAIVLIVDTDDGLDAGVVMANTYATYDGDATAAYNKGTTTVAAAVGTPAKNITIYGGATLGAALTLALKKGDVEIAKTLAGAGDITVPEDTTLTLDSGVGLTTTGNLTVNGTVEGESATAAASITAANVTIKGSNAEISLPAGTLNATNLYLQDAAQADVDTANVTTTVYIACELKVKTLTATNVILAGDAEGSSLEVATSATIGTLYVGGETVNTTTGAPVADASVVSADSTVILPAGKQTTIATVAVNGGATVVNDVKVTALNLADGAAVTFVPENADDGTAGSTGTEIGTVTAAGDATVEATAAIGIDAVAANGKASNTVTIPAGTESTSGGATSTTGSATVDAGTTEVKVAVSTTGKGSESTGTYFVKGDTVTVTFTKALDTTATVTSTNPGVATAAVSGSTLTLTITAEKVDAATQVKVTGLKVASSALASNEEAVECSVTVTIPALRSGSATATVN